MVVEWIARKYLPINFFEDEVTPEFFAYLNKDVNLPQKNALRSMISSTFKDMQEDVVKTLQKNGSKISFTIDSWTSIAAICFYGITG